MLLRQLLLLNFVLHSSSAAPVIISSTAESPKFVKQTPLARSSTIFNTKLLVKRSYIQSTSNPTTQDFEMLLNCWTILAIGTGVYTLIAAIFDLVTWILLSRLQKSTKELALTNQSSKHIRSKSLKSKPGSILVSKSSTIAITLGSPKVKVPTCMISPQDDSQKKKSKRTKEHYFPTIDEDSTQEQDFSIIPETEKLETAFGKEGDGSAVSSDNQPSTGADKESQKKFTARSKTSSSSGSTSWSTSSSGSSDWSSSATSLASDSTASSSTTHTSGTSASSYSTESGSFGSESGSRGSSASDDEEYTTTTSAESDYESGSILPSASSRE